MVRQREGQTQVTFHLCRNAGGGWERTWKGRKLGLLVIECIGKTIAEQSSRAPTLDYCKNGNTELVKSLPATMWLRRYVAVPPARWGPWKVADWTTWRVGITGQSNFVELVARTVSLSYTLEGWLEPRWRQIIKEGITGVLPHQKNRSLAAAGLVSKHHSRLAAQNRNQRGSGG